MTRRNGPATTGVVKYRQRHSTCCFITSCNQSLLASKSAEHVSRLCWRPLEEARFSRSIDCLLGSRSTAHDHLQASVPGCHFIFHVSWFTSLHRLPVDTVGIRVRVIELSSMLLHSFPPCFFYCLLLIWPNARPDVRTSGHHALLWSLGSLPHVLLRCS